MDNIPRFGEHEELSITEPRQIETAAGREIRLANEAANARKIANRRRA